MFADDQVDDGIRIDAVLLGDLCERAAATQPLGQRVDVDADQIGHLLSRLLTPLLASLTTGPFGPDLRSPCVVIRS